MSELDSLFAEIGWTGTRIPKSEIFSTALRLLTAEVTVASTRSPQELLDSLVANTGPSLLENAQSLASMYAAPEAQTKVRTTAAEVGIPLLRVLVADLCGPFSLAEARFLDENVWLGFAETTYAAVAMLWRDHRVFAEQLAATDAIVGDRDLNRELLQSLVRYGVSSDEAMIPELLSLYGTAIRVLSTQERRDLASFVAGLAEQRKVSLNVLMPFLFVDDCQAVISTAALAFAELGEPSNGDPLTGARYLLEQAATRPEGTRVGILGGLLLLGDRRVTDLVGPCWRQLSLEGREDLSHIRSGYLHAPLIEWFIEWLEDCEGNEFGFVAAALARMPSEALVPRVADVRRHFPSWQAESGYEVEVIKEWSLAEYAQVIAPRLRGIAARETAPHVMPDVLKQWGLT